MKTSTNGTTNQDLNFPLQLFRGCDQSHQAIKPPRAYFLLAEGNYPFPSTYIPSAVGDGGTLPAWPMRVACSHLNEDFGVQLEGSLKELNYTVTAPKKMVGWWGWWGWWGWYLILLGKT